MDGKCDFCEGTLAPGEPDNVALLAHLRVEPECRQQFGFMIDNLHASWIKGVSGP